MDTHPNLLLLMAACAAKAVIKHRPRRRRHGQLRTAASSSDAWSDSCSETSSGPLHSHQLSFENENDVSPSPCNHWYTSLSLVLSHQLRQLSALLRAAVAALVADVTFLALNIVRCQWTLRWLLAVEAAAAEAFVADFDLFGHWTPSRLLTEAAAPVPAVPQAPHCINDWLGGSWNLSKAWDLNEKQPSAAELLKLGGLARTGMRMFKGMEFSVEDNKLFMTALTKLPWLKVSPEVYSTDGSVSSHNRRDMRKGKSLGYVKVLADGGVDLYNKWEDPVAGFCIDEMRLLGRNELRITTHLQVGAQSGAYCVVYTRTREARSRRTPAAAAAVAPAPGLKHVPSLQRIAEFPPREALHQRSGQLVF